MSAVASSFGSSSATPPENETTPTSGKRALLQRDLESIEETLGVAAVGLREHHAEPAACDPAGKVARADQVVQHASDRRENVVGGEVADARIDRREAVDVEDEQRERLASASGAADLEVEKRVESRAVVEIGQRVALGNRIGLAKLE